MFHPADEPDLVGYYAIRILVLGSAIWVAWGTWNLIAQAV